MSRVTGIALVLACLLAAWPARASGGRVGDERNITADPAPRLDTTRVLQSRALPVWAEEAWAAAQKDTSDHDAVRLLLADDEVVVLDSLETVETIREVLLVRERRFELPLWLSYEPGISRVEDFTSWAVAGGKVFAYPLRMQFDRALSRDSLHVTLRHVGSVLTVGPGTLVAFEAVRRCRTFQSSWVMNGLSVDGIRFAHFRLQLPDGMTPEAVAVPESLGRAVHDEDGWSWTLPDRPPPVRGDLTVLPDAWQLAVRIRPGAGGRMPAGSFATWEDFGRWVGAHAIPTQRETPRLRAVVDSVRALHPRREDLVRALATRVQSLRYVSVAVHTEIGGGWVPRPAEDVWLDGQGDCKDKANLLCTLLHAAGVRAWPVAARVAAMFLPTPWPCTGAFDHEIAAIEWPGESGPAMVESARFGRLLLFDPTDSRTPWGQVPSALSDGTVMLVSDSVSYLFTVPPLTRERNYSVRVVTGEIDDAGRVTSRVRQSAMGPDAEALDALAHSLSGDDVHFVLGHQVATAWPGARLDSEFVSRDSTGLAHAGFRIRHDGHGRRVVRMPMRALFGVTGGDALADSSERVVTLRASRDSVAAELRLPPGTAVDSLPEAVEFRNACGRVSARAERSGDAVRWTRTFVTEREVVPVARFRELRELFQAVSRAEAAVLQVHLAGEEPPRPPPVTPPPPPPHGRPGIHGG